MLMLNYVALRAGLKKKHLNQTVDEDQKGTRKVRGGWRRIAMILSDETEIFRG